jgi:ferrous iron transport protein B
MIAQILITSLLTLVWLASTFSACLVTLWTVRREMGWRVALQLFGRQTLTSTIVALLITPLSLLSK